MAKTEERKLEPFSSVLKVRLTAQTHREFLEACREREITASEFVRRSVRKQLDKWNAEQKRNER